MAEQNIPPQPKMTLPKAPRMAQPAPQMQQKSMVQPTAQPMPAKPVQQPVAPAQKPMPTPAQPAPQPVENVDAHMAPLTTFADDFKLPESVLTTKVISMVLAGACFLGFILGGMLLGGSDAPQKPTGLQGVVKNSDITGPMPRCGRIDKGRACILYIVNHTRYDKKAEDFFNDAVLLTEAPKYNLSMSNAKYAKTRIPPGYFAEIKIPDIR